MKLFITLLFIIALPFQVLWADDFPSEEDEEDYEFIDEEYILVKGEGVDVCEDYRKNREALSLVSKFSRHRIQPDFSKVFIEPDWFIPEKTEYNLFKGRIGSLYWEEKWKYYPNRRFSSFGYNDLYGKSIDPNIFKQTSVIFTWFDINNDGSDELVARYRRNSLVVVEPMSGVVNRNLSKLLLLNFSTTIEKINDTTIEKVNADDYILKGAGKWADVKYSIFQYKGRTYFCRQSVGQPIGREFFALYIINDTILEEVCRYQNNSTFTSVPRADLRPWHPNSK